MANYIVSDTNLQSVANHIRTKGGTSAPLSFPDGFNAAIDAIPTGGGGTVKLGALRPDAELWKSWSYDKMIVADEHVTIPAYSTTAATLKASETLETVTLDTSNYYYLFVYRCLSTPQYSDSTNRKGKEEYCLSVGTIQEYYVPDSQFVSASGQQVSSTYGWTAALQAVQFQGLSHRTLYWYSGTSLRTANNQYGAYISSPTFSTSYPSVTVTSPSMVVKGSATYAISSTAWEYLTDIRYQYIIELYRIPLSASVQGFVSMSLVRHILDCVNNNNGKLT